MSFTVPTFNITVNLWRSTSDPDVDPPDVITTANLAWGRRVGATTAVWTIDTTWLPNAMVLLMPSHTDVRSDEKSGAGKSDTAEAPAGTGRMYRVTFVDDIGRGFANEHRAAVIIAMPPWPEPYP